MLEILFVGMCQPMQGVECFRCGLNYVKSIQFHLARVICEVAEVAVGRSEEKSAIVRKSTLNLLIMMLLL